VNKASLKRLAVEVRREIGLSPHDRFDPLQLAEAYGIDVFPLSELECAPEVLAHFQNVRTSVFSGALVPLSDGSTVIVENDMHALERRVSTASHEMAHVILEHPFAATIADGNGCRIAEAANEAEAAELGGELLLPAEAARRLAYNNVPDEDVARRFGVSLELARWRMDATGARRVAARAHAKRAGQRAR
jgi:Zn-dependent peptidase ImmA (M78 family)